MQETRSDPSRRAIYVDIESLRTDPPHVAILGVLTGDAGEDIEQLIVDPGLAPARAAKRPAWWPVVEVRGDFIQCPVARVAVPS